MLVKSGNGGGAKWGGRFRLGITRHQVQSCGERAILAQSEEELLDGEAQRSVSPPKSLAFSPVGIHHRPGELWRDAVEGSFSTGWTLARLVGH